MSNTEWYAQIETAKPWKAFNAYAKAVSAALNFSHSDRRNDAEGQTSNESRATGILGATAAIPAPVLNAEMLASVAALAKGMFDSLPASAKDIGQRCAGLPRVYPKQWLRRPHSNSLMFEFKTVQSIPSNGLKSWKG